MTSGRRYALIISNSNYQDHRLAKLTTPAADAAGLRAVLEDSTICAFDEVTLLENQSSYQVRIALAQFFAGKKRDDLLLLYFSGHGLLDVNNRFYLAL
ncbi:MAG: caspase family protein, partial [Anaerolineales bacterium]|nr:caspase family protein [Anaerolineales bacterium]